MDMILPVGTAKASISTTDLHYIIGASDVRQYDACYYELVLDAAMNQTEKDDLINNNAAVGIHFKLK